MTDDKLLALAERCEQATGPDRELDALIRCAVFAGPDAFVEQSPINGAWCIYEPSWREGARPRSWEPRGLSQLQRLGEFTASLDAAMALGNDEQASGILHEAWDRLSMDHGLHMRRWKAEDGDYAQCLARYLTAAWLRSLANKETEK